MTESDPTGSAHDTENSQIFWRRFFECIDILKKTSCVFIDENEVWEMANAANKGRAENFLFRSVCEAKPNEDEKDTLRIVFDFLFETGYLKIEPDTDPFTET